MFDSLLSNRYQNAGHIVGGTPQLGDIQQTLAALLLVDPVDHLEEHLLIGHLVGQAVRAQEDAFLLPQLADEDVALAAV